jgi:hypothetical protein
MVNPTDAQNMVMLNSTTDKGPFKVLFPPPIPKKLYEQKYYGPLRVEGQFPPPVPDTNSPQEIAQYKKHSGSKLTLRQAIYTQICPKPFTKRQKAAIVEIFGQR